MSTNLQRNHHLSGLPTCLPACPRARRVHRFGQEGWGSDGAGVLVPVGGPVQRRQDDPVLRRLARTPDQCYAEVLRRFQEKRARKRNPPAAAAVAAAATAAEAAAAAAAGGSGGGLGSGDSRGRGGSGGGVAALLAPPTAAEQALLRQEAAEVAWQWQAPRIAYDESVVYSEDQAVMRYLLKVRVTSCR